MHAVRFNVRLRAPRAIADIVADLSAHPRLATTAKFDSNRVFELGRRYGFQGRLYAHAVVVANDCMVSGRTVKGWAFVPQEGNTLLSTLEAFLLQTETCGRKGDRGGAMRGARGAPVVTASGFARATWGAGALGAGAAGAGAGFGVSVLALSGLAGSAFGAAGSFGRA